MKLSLVRCGYFPPAPCSAQPQAGCCFLRVGGCAAALPSTGPRPTPHSPALFEAGMGPSGQHGKYAFRRGAETKLRPVPRVGWFPLTVSVLAAVLSCGSEAALPPPCTVLCQQEVWTPEIKYDVSLKWLSKEKRIPLEHSLCLRPGIYNSSCSFFIFL